MIDDNFYNENTGDAMSPQERAQMRQQQALQAALVGQQNTVDPNQPAAAADPNADLPIWQQPWEAGSDHPQGAPPGMHWDANMASFMPDVQSPTTPTGDVNQTPSTQQVPQAPAAPGAPAPSGGPLPSGPGANTSWQDYINSFNSMQHVTAPQLPNQQLPLYQPQQLLTQDALGAEGQQFALLQRVLAQPDQYSEQNVRQMQEAQKEQALALQKGNQQKLTDRYAAMGRYGSGNLDAQSRRMNDTTTSQILQGNRDVDLQASTANMNSRMAALQNANSVLNESVGRRQAQANQEYLGYNSQKDQVNFGLQQALAQAGLGNQANTQNMQQQQLALQAALGTGGLSLDQYKTDLSNNLGWYNSLSTNDNFLKQLLSNLSMFNTSQTNQSNNS